jgi:hypothetical protein
VGLCGKGFSSSSGESIESSSGTTDGKALSVSEEQFASRNVRNFL